MLFRSYCLADCLRDDILTEMSDNLAGWRWQHVAEGAATAAVRRLTPELPLEPTR